MQPGTLYRGREGMWTWVLHRVSGVAILFYLFAHVVDQALLNVSPEAYDRVIDTYRNPFVGLLEIGLAVVVIFHALNGVRIILFDFWSQGWPASARCSGSRRCCSWSWRSRR